MGRNLGPLIVMAGIIIAALVILGAHFDISRRDDVTGVTAAGHRNSFARDCIRHWQATKQHL